MRESIAACARWSTVRRFAGAVAVSALAGGTVPPAHRGYMPSGSPQLPAPTGQYGVGRAQFHWIDSSRTDPFAGPVGARREIMVYVWYPTTTRPGATSAVYMPHVDAIGRSIGDSALREEFGAALNAVRLDSIHSYAVDGAALAPTKRMLPVLVFSHGFGESSLTYSAQLTELASHGYVVFAVEHPHDAFAVWFPDGRVVPFASAGWSAAQQQPNGAVAYQLAQVPIRAADIRFVIDRIIDLNDRATGIPAFHHRLDLTRLAVFGHSLGGVAAASVCRIDARVRACANEDADDDGRPFAGGIMAAPIKQPFLFFASGHSIYVSPRTPSPTDAGLERMKLTRAQYDSIVTLYQRNQDSALRTMPGGAVRVMAEADDFTHRTFIDLKMLQAASDSAAAVQSQYMGLVRRYLLAFFDETLDGRPTALWSSQAQTESIVTTQRFGP